MRTNSPASPSGCLSFLQIWPHRWDFYHKPQFVNLPSKLTDRFLLPDFNINRNISSKHSFLCICFKQPMVKWPRRLKFWNCSTPTGDGAALVTHCCCFLSFSSPPGFSQPKLCEWTYPGHGCDNLSAFGTWRLFRSRGGKQNTGPVSLLWKPKALSGAKTLSCVQHLCWEIPKEDHQLT